MTDKGIVRLVKLANIIKKGEYIMIDMNLESAVNTEQKNQKKKILDDIKSLSRSFELVSPEEKKDIDFGFSQLSLKNVDDDKIKKESENSLAYYKAKGEKDIETSFDSKKENINTQIADTKNSGEQKKEKITQNAGEQRQGIKNAMINKNLVRSSIYQNMMTDSEKQELAELDNVANETNNKIETLNGELIKLDGEKQSALELFNIAYAVKLEDEIAKLKKSIDSYNSQAIKYNNTILQKEQELQEKYDKQYQAYLDDVEKRNREVYKFIASYGQGNSNARLERQKYDMALDYLNTMDKETALEVLTEDDEFKVAVGDSNYEKLLDAINNRKS